MLDLDLEMIFDKAEDITLLKVAIAYLVVLSAFWDVGVLFVLFTLFVLFVLVDGVLLVFTSKTKKKTKVSCISLNMINSICLVPIALHGTFKKNIEYDIFNHRYTILLN